MNRLVRCLYILSLIASVTGITTSSYSADAFIDINANLVALKDSRLAWGDYDGDGDLDLVVAGNDGTSPVCRVYRNDSGSFTDSRQTLNGAQNGSVSWADYDNDGDIDLLVAGNNGSVPSTRLYRNNEGIFRDSGIQFEGVERCSSAWADYDNDGDLDLVLAGNNGTLPVTHLYRNDNSGFTKVTIYLPGVESCALAWGDYNNDGWVDLAIAGTSRYGVVTRVFKNTGWTLSETYTMSLAKLTKCSLAWSDYDSDGDLDLAAAGNSDGYCRTILYRNSGSLLSATGVLLSGVENACLAWGDFDNDGKVDLAVSGSAGTNYQTLIYKNSSTFNGINSGLQSFAGSLAWGDYDNDGDLDLAATGITSNGPSTRVYANVSNTTNTPPTAPSGLTAAISNTSIAFSWNRSSDAQTFQNGLHYNLRVGTTPGGNEVLSGMADASTGYRRLPALGNVQERINRTINRLTKSPTGRYYWSVQAIDSAYAGSSWAEEQTLHVVVVSGRVTTSDGTGLGGVSVTPAGSETSATTDANGFYYLFFTPGWSGSITVSKTGFVFEPASRSYENIIVDQDNQNYKVQSGFVDSGIALPGLPDSSSVYRKTLAWGDYDNDGDLDLVICGKTVDNVPITRIYRNDRTSFNDINAGLTGVDYGALAWGDYDNDNDLDLVVCGKTSSGAHLTAIYRNDNGGFLDIQSGVPGFSNGSVSWVDYDNDGYLDLSISGSITSGYANRIYRNDNGSFVDINAGLPAVSVYHLPWGDYDNDGDYDLLICSLLYRNESGVLINSGNELPVIYINAVAWGDYDADGDLDLAVGSSSYSYTSTVLRNDGGRFTDIKAGFPSLENSSLAWGDYDNDGDLDLVISGSAGSGGNKGGIYRNDDGTFTKTDVEFDPISYGTVAWADYDCDGDLDLTLAGTKGGSYLKIYQNVMKKVDRLPLAPRKLSANPSDGGVSFSWSAAMDAETPSSALSYNIRVGRSPGASDVFSGMASSSGTRLKLSAGNAQTRLSWTLRNLPGGTYYWSVQAIDTAFAGSVWAKESSVSFVSISGSVTDASGAPLRGAVVTASGGSSSRSDEKGHYVLNVPVNWSGTTTVYKAAYSFEPSGRAYSGVLNNLTEEDYIGTCWLNVVPTGIDPLRYSTFAWGDYDSDGDLDAVAVGSSTTGPVTKIYRNDSGTFTDINAGLTAAAGHAVWGDYDNDGDLDLMITGNQISKIYRNDMGSFTDINAGLATGYKVIVAWGDYDNDGDQDLVMSDDRLNDTKLYRNDAGKFVEVKAGLVRMYGGTLAWGDYDNDGDLDLALTGTAGNTPETKLYRNDAGTFTDTQAPFVQVGDSSLAWGDYDNDGDLDLVVAGSSSTIGSLSKRTAIIYRNDNGTFTNIGAGLDTETRYASVAWGDFDNDGDLDLVLSGSDDTVSRAIIFANENGHFTKVDASLGGGAYGSTAWGDYDGDGDLDLALTGLSGSVDTMTLIRNDCPVRNLPPSAPTSLSSRYTAGLIEFSWAAASDDHTSPSGLYYNLRIGTEPGKDDVFSGMADASGYRKLPAIGNAQSRLSWSIKNLIPRIYYWSVQTIDSSFQGSAWAEGELPVISISGKVRTISGQPIMGATVSLDNGLATSTDISGRYVLPIGVGWSGTVTVSKTMYSFTPSSRSYQGLSSDIKDQDFTGGGGFSDTGVRLAGQKPSWGDYDGDGLLDLACPSWTGVPTRLYHNNGDQMVDTGVVLGTGSQASWGDYDKDGDLDLVVSSALYQNNTGTLNLVRSFSGNYPPAWADYDNDGDLDLTFHGNLLRNENGVFVRHTGYGSGEQAWGDYDSDGDLDLYTGLGSNGEKAQIFRNDKGTFTDIGVTSGGTYGVWGDYDSDGDLDLAMGSFVGYHSVWLLRNDAGTFVSVMISGSGDFGPPAWADFDNDGDLDLISGGRIFRNDGGTFEEIDAAIPNGYPAWGDFDNDGDLDLAIGIWDGSSSTWVTRIYRNDLAGPNIPPSAPDGLQATVEGDGITFRWQPATDAETATTALSYNLRVGTSAGGCEISSGHSNASTGIRYLPGMGNAQQCLSWHLKLPVPGKVYWSVQTIDSGYQGSQWATEQIVESPVISGCLRNPDGQPIAHAVVTSSNGVSAITDVNGFFSFAVSRGWTGTVSASKALYKFEPAARSFEDVQADFSNQDFTGTGGFSDIGTDFNGSTIYWIDYDNDGDLDLSSQTTNGNAMIYRNSNGMLSNADIGVVSGYNSDTLAWGDYDRDGFIDVAAGGNIYRNTGGSFVSAFGPFTSTYGSVPSWADYDNDGDLDYSIYINLYQNTGMSFKEIQRVSALTWADYDNDGDMDAAVWGAINRNDGGTFRPVIIGTASGPLYWGDYDADGDLDIAVPASPSYTYATIYENKGGGNFSQMDPGIIANSLAWGDYDNDGDLDLVALGYISYRKWLIIYVNNGSGFVQVRLEGPDYSGNNLAWGDYDNDGDLDLAVSGSANVGRIYRNDCARSNTVPVAPTGLKTQQTSSGIIFSWNAASDAETPPGGLSYNFRVGTQSGASDVCSGMADLSGFRRLPALGNAQKRLSWSLKNLPLGVYYWSVQAIDSAYAGSGWSAEQVVYVGLTGVSDAKESRNGTMITCKPVVVTAIFDDCAYVESPDRSSGIRIVNSLSGLTLGMKVILSGTLGTASDGERFLNVVSVTQNGTASVEPLVMTNKSLGGGDWKYNPSTGNGQRGIEEGVGLNNIGLLIRTSGRVTAVGEGYFYIDDGSRVRDDSIFAGLRVVCSSGVIMPQLGQTVSVTGVSSLLNIGSRYFRSIRPRNTGDIQILL